MHPYRQQDTMLSTRSRWSGPSYCLAIHSCFPLTNHSVQRFLLPSCYRKPKDVLCAVSPFQVDEFHSGVVPMYSVRHQSHSTFPLP